MPNLRVENEDFAKGLPNLPEGFGPGPDDTYMCLTCGASVARRVANKIQAWERHDKWHDDLEEAFTQRPGSMGGDNRSG